MTTNADNSPNPATSSSTEGAPANAAPAEGAPAAAPNPAEAAPAAKPAEGDKPAEGAKPEDKAPEGDKPADAPVEYVDFKLPEGAQIDDVIMAEFKTFGQTHKFTQDQMQGLLDLQGKLNQTVAEQVKKTREDWRKASETDSEFGGAKFSESKAAIAKARDAFASQPLVDLLDNFGLSDHPEVLRHFYKLGLKISEDNATPGGTSAAQSAEAEAPQHILYGKK